METDYIGLVYFTAVAFQGILTLLFGLVAAVAAVLIFFTCNGLLIRARLRHIPGPRIPSCGKVCPVFRSALNLPGGLPPTTLASHNHSVKLGLHTTYGSLIRTSGVGTAPLLSLADPVEAVRFLQSDKQDIHSRNIMKPFFGQVGILFFASFSTLLGAHSPSRL